MLELLNAIENVFRRYIPWHSEAEMLNSLKSIETLRGQLTNPEPITTEDTSITAAPAATLEPAHPPVTPVDSTAAGAADSNAGAPVTDPANSTQETAAPVSTALADASIAVSPVEPVHISEPEWTPFPGSYTPPPAA